MRQVRDLQMSGTRSGEAGWSAGKPDGFSGLRPFQIHGTCAKRHLSVAAWLKRRTYFAGSWVDGYKHALRYRNYADSCVHDFSGVREGEVGE